MMSVISGSIVLSVWLAIATAFPNGAPDIACSRMIPAGHFPTTTSGDSPFILNISTTSYKPGDIITGSLTSATGEKFRGFLIQVGANGDAGSDEKSVGEFDSLVAISKHVCGKKGITHNSRDEKTEVMFSWKAPDTLQGDLYVRATVVQQYLPSKYWLNNFSSKIVATQ